MKKTILALILCFAVAFAFTACGSDDEKAEEKKDTNGTVS